MKPNNSALVSVAWLSEHLQAPDVRIVDASYFLPAEKRDAQAEFEEAHIPGAVFFDIDEIKDDNSDLPHMLPSPEKFSSRVRNLGLGDGNRIVVYDRLGMRSSPRVWWTFKVFGHSDVTVLDGGLPKWQAEGKPVESGPMRLPGPRHFTARKNSFLVKDKDQMMRNLESQRFQVVDARSRGRFDGSEPELWPGRRSGHIPGSLNLPFTDVIDSASGVLLPNHLLLEHIEKAGIDLSKPIVTTCGSGITASVLALALHEIGHKDFAVYDGSWSEWGLDSSGTPVESGEIASN
ncbi:3-mercaptopyruvate sulfurtransferase [Limibacillus sp. MBR-115]|jgi:thiosulfate/3-mercaptopyruvate sulfurtransferase|uniref:3-mercaptopyruvate sulfurtransferase n=1 Tax=Limibacillus sp. MBR-115 TaxID=3156465 RepID=UPI003391B4B6